MLQVNIKHTYIFKFIKQCKVSYITGYMITNLCYIIITCYVTYIITHYIYVLYSTRHLLYNLCYLLTSKQNQRFLTYNIWTAI